MIYTDIFPSRTVRGLCRYIAFFSGGKLQPFIIFPMFFPDEGKQPKAHAEGNNYRQQQQNTFPCKQNPVKRHSYRTGKKTGQCRYRTGHPLSVARHPPCISVYLLIALILQIVIIHIHDFLHIFPGVIGIDKIPFHLAVFRHHMSRGIACPHDYGQQGYLPDKLPHLYPCGQFLHQQGRQPCPQQRGSHRRCHKQDFSPEKLLVPFLCRFHIINVIAHQPVFPPCFITIDP